MTTNDSNLRKNQVQLLFGLKAELEGHNERAVDLGKDKSLRKGVSDLIPCDDVCFAYSLKSIDTRSIAFTDLHHLPNQVNQHRRIAN